MAKQSSPTIIPPADSELQAFEEESAKSKRDEERARIKHIGRMMNSEMKEDAQRARWGAD